mgnify:CR=1 FL=1
MSEVPPSEGSTPHAEQAPKAAPPPGVYGAGALLALWVLLPPFAGFYLLSQIAPQHSA